MIFPNGAHDEVGVDFDEVIVAEVLDQAMADEGVGFVDEDFGLVGLGDGRVVFLGLGHY